MPKFIHTVPLGDTNSVYGMPGSIIGVATLSKEGATSDYFDHDTLANSGIAFVQVPEDSDPQVGAVLASSLSVGTANSEIASVSDFVSGMSFPPMEGLINNGTEWVAPGGNTIGRVLSLTIKTPGNGYSTSTNIETFLNIEEDEKNSFGLTVDITSVGSSGEVTQIQVNSKGYLFSVGDEVILRGGAGNCILEVASIEYPKIATFNTARPTSNPNTLSPSYFQSLFPMVTGESVYLYQPTTESRVFYDESLSGDFRFSSGSADIFDGTDFTLEIRTIRNNFLLTTVTVPLSDANQSIDLNSVY